MVLVKRSVPSMYLAMADCPSGEQMKSTIVLAASMCGASLITAAANADAEQALVSGKVDAWVIDDLTAAEMVAEFNGRGGQQLTILGDAMTTEPYAFCTALGNDDLIAGINDVIKNMLSDGTIAKLFEKYDAPYTKP